MFWHELGTFTRFFIQIRCVVDKEWERERERKVSESEREKRGDKVATAVLSL